jgi:hypothetical protein
LSGAQQDCPRQTLLSAPRPTARWTGPTIATRPSAPLGRDASVGAGVSPEGGQYTRRYLACCPRLMAATGLTTPDKTSQKEQADESRPKPPTHDDIARLAYAIYVGKWLSGWPRRAGLARSRADVDERKNDDIPRPRNANDPQGERSSGARESDTDRVRAE